MDRSDLKNGKWMKEKRKEDERWNTGKKDEKS
jgi:hypothetical protein